MTSLILEPLFWDALHVIVLSVGGGYGIGLAIRRCNIADSARQQDLSRLAAERFRLAAELLDMEKSSYASRVAGAVLMAQLADENETYRGPTIRAFMGWLTHPPVFPYGHKYDGITDYKSADTMVIVEWLNAQSLKASEIDILPEFAPFLIDIYGTVGRNPVHSHWKKWEQENIDAHYLPSRLVVYRGPGAFGATKAP